MRLVASLLALLTVQQSRCSTVAAGATSQERHILPRSVAHAESHIEESYWYDWGIYGPFPRQSYESYGAESPWPNLLQQDERCRNKEDGYIVVAPRGRYVRTAGPVILDNDGNLVWMDTRWTQAMDVRIQSYKDEDYVTFWTGEDGGNFGRGHYIMLNKHYEVFKKVFPVGNYTGDLHEFHISDAGTALITIYDKAQADLSQLGSSPEGWIYDSIFQEIDIATGDLLFEWHASDHIPIHETRQELRGDGGSKSAAFDFFHINSVDKTQGGDFIISARYFNVFCIDGKDGSVKWRLGGPRNDFTDMSGGAATNFTWNHHAVLHEGENRKQLTLFDNSATDRVKSFDYSRGMLMDLDIDNRTVTLVQSYVSPQKLSAPSQGSVQMLPSGNVLVGWGHTAAWTEFTLDGEVLCDTHMEPLWFADLGWVKSYRTWKSPWVGRPKTLPDRAMRASESALYVSWNGATEVDQWLLQSGPRSDGDDFRDHFSFGKEAFETRFEVPDDAKKFLRVAALDADGALLAYSKPVSKSEETVVKKLVGKGGDRWMLPEPMALFGMCLGAAIGIAAVLLYFRGALMRGYRRVVRRGVARYRYQSLPTT